MLISHHFKGENEVGRSENGFSFARGCFLELYVFVVYYFRSFLFLFFVSRFLSIQPISLQNQSSIIYILERKKECEKEHIPSCQIAI